MQTVWACYTMGNIFNDHAEAEGIEKGKENE